MEYLCSLTFYFLKWVWDIANCGNVWLSENVCVIYCPHYTVLVLQVYMLFSFPSVVVLQVCAWVHRWVSVWCLSFRVSTNQWLCLLSWPGKMGLHVPGFSRVLCWRVCSAAVHSVNYNTLLKWFLSLRSSSASISVEVIQQLWCIWNEPVRDGIIIVPLVNRYN